MRSAGISLNNMDALSLTHKALKLAPTSQGVEVEAALAFAMAGDTARAESLAQDLGKRFPLDTQMQSHWLPAIQAQLALDKKNPAPALNALQAASPIELGQILFVANISCLYPTYVRGEAYLAAGQGKEAPSSSRRSSTTAASSGTAGLERWRIWAWLVLLLCRRKLCRERMPMPPASGRSPSTKIFSRSGRTPTPTSPS
jgi:hypothetical protein